MWLIGLLLIWFALSFVAALAFAAFMRAGRGPEPSVSVAPTCDAHDQHSTPLAA